MIAVAQKRMWLDPKMAFHRHTYGIDLALLDRGWVTAKSHNGMNAWRTEYLCAPFEITAKENVAGKQGQREPLLAVIPLPERLVNRQKNLQPASQKVFGDGLFMLMPCINRVPFVH